MPSDSRVIADPASGAAIVAGTRVAMSAAANGALRFGGADGRVLRPLTFGERTELVSAASALPAARDAVAAGILAAATLERGAGATSLMEVLAMWLAGAAFDAPDFMETTLLVARAAGWPPHELFTAPAREVDRLAVHLDEQRRTSEWKSLVFAEAPAETIEAVRARFADRLLRRSNAAVVNEESTEEASSSVPRFLGVPRAALLPQSTTVVSEPDERTPTQRHSPGIAQQQQTMPSHRFEEPLPPREAAARAPIPSEQNEAMPTIVHERAPSVRGVRLVVPREQHQPAPRSTHTSSVAVSEQRRALAFAIRQPRAHETRVGTESVETFRSAAATLPLSKAAALLPHSETEPQHEAHFPERVPIAAPPSAAPRVIAPYPDDLAATLAALLDDEADLRGVDR
jgi:hypothetical protein